MRFNILAAWPTPLIPKDADIAMYNKYWYQSGNELIFWENIELVVDRSSLIFAELIGLIFLMIMLISVSKLQRRNGYVRYFILLGLCSGLVYLFSFSGSFFHDFYDPLISYIGSTGISF